MPARDRFIFQALVYCSRPFDKWISGFLRTYRQNICWDRQHVSSNHFDISRRWRRAPSIFLKWYYHSMIPRCIQTSEDACLAGNPSWHREWKRNRVIEWWWCLGNHGQRWARLALQCATAKIFAFGCSLFRIPGFIAGAVLFGSHICPNVRSGISTYTSRRLVHSASEFMPMCGDTDI